MSINSIPEKKMLYIEGLLSKLFEEAGVEEMTVEFNYQNTRRKSHYVEMTSDVTYKWYSSEC